MKVLTIVLLVALTAKCAMTIKQQNNERQQTFERVDPVDTNKIEVTEGASRNKRQWGKSNLQN